VAGALVCITVRPPASSFSSSLLSFLHSLSLSLSSLHAAAGDLELRSPLLPNLSVKLFPKVSSPYSPIYFKNAP
jgi:hypothetical protein